MVIQSKRDKRERVDKCDAKIRLVEGRATYRTSSGKIAELTEPNQVICISAAGDVTRSTSSESILTFDSNLEGKSAGIPAPPPSGGNGGGNGGNCGSRATENCQQ